MIKISIFIRIDNLTGFIWLKGMYEKSIYSQTKSFGN